MELIIILHDVQELLEVVIAATVALVLEVLHPTMINRKQIEFIYMIVNYIFQVKLFTLEQSHSRPYTTKSSWILVGEGSVRALMQ